MGFGALVLKIDKKLDLLPKECFEVKNGIDGVA